ncbi:MAG TPA: efflux RND transporter periplasmic adaptor subunit [Gemmataceae bacterium]|jgi:RND family efflux transporter MFP subunit
MSWLEKHKKAALIVGAAAAVLLIGGLFYLPHRYEENKASARDDNSTPAKPSAPLRVQVIEPKEGGVERLVRRPATVQSFEFANLYAKVSGYLSGQEVDIGSKVKEGDVLAKVYAPEKDKDVEKANADLAKTRADYNAKKARVDKANADLKAAQSQYERTKADVKKAQALVTLRRKIYQRYKGLAAEKAIQEELVDEKLEAQIVAEEQENAAEKAVDAAKSAVVAAGAEVEQTKADLKDAEAAIGVAQAALDRAKVWADYTTITAPYTGVVTKRNFHNRDFIRDASQGGALPMLMVARTDKMRIIVQVPDRDVPYLHEGAPADLKIDTLSDRHFKGTVARKAYQEAYDTRTMRTEVDILNPDGLLTDGMYGEIVIHLGREKGLRIPSKCLVGDEKDDERSVFVVRDGRAREVKVQVGIDDGIETTIHDGLSKSDRVVVERPPGLADGMRVEVIRTNSEDADKEDKSK